VFSRHRWSACSVPVLAALVAALVATPAMAAPSAGADPAVAAVFARFGAGTYTAADVKLVKSKPALARVVIDPGRTTSVVEDSNPELTAALSGRGNRTADALAETCGRRAVVITATSYLGDVIFQWRHDIGICSDGTKVTRWNGRFDRLDYAQSIVELGALTTDSASSVGGWGVTSVMQRTLALCVVNYGCYANRYPWSEIYIQADYHGQYWWGV